jgi:hypothetical protein
VYDAVASLLLLVAAIRFSSVVSSVRTPPAVNVLRLLMLTSIRANSVASSVRTPAAVSVLIAPANAVTLPVAVTNPPVLFVAFVSNASNTDASKTSQLCTAVACAVLPE